MACRLDCIIHIDTEILFNVGYVSMTFKNAIVSCFYNNRLFKFYAFKGVLVISQLFSLTWNV